jgi:small subunit ribosomal protein S16
MALSIRLQRRGSNSNPHYRLVVAERAGRRDGRFVEELGDYSPREEGSTRYLNLKLERVDYWTKVGAQLSDSAAGLVKKARKAAATKAA